MFKSHIAVVHLEPLDRELAVASHWVVMELFPKDDLFMQIMVGLFYVACVLWFISLFSSRGRGSGGSNGGSSCGSSCGGCGGGD